MTHARRPNDNHLEAKLNAVGGFQIMGVQSKFRNFVNIALVSLFALTSTLAVETQPENAATAGKFPDSVNRFISTYCISCHGPKKSKADLRFDSMSQDLAAGPHAEDWHEVLDALNKGEMPPEREKQPSDVERNEIIGYLTAAFKEAASKRRSAGGKVVMRRLTNYEYDNTLNDLLALNENWSKDFPPDSASVEGFKNNGALLGMSSLQIENYLEVAKKALDEAIFTGDRPGLKTIDIKDVEHLNHASGAKYPIKQRNIHGLLHWKDHPRSGPVVIDAVLSGVKDIESLRGQLHLQAGVRLRKKGNPLYGMSDVAIEPRIEKDKDVVRVQYKINKIEEYPLPDLDSAVSDRFIDLVFDLTSPISGIRVESMTAKGAFFEMWPPKSHQMIFMPSKNDKNEDVYAREIINNFTARAWRRPVSDSETAPIIAAYKEIRKNESFVNAIKLTLARALVSPNFLYLVEAKSPSNGIEKLSAHELANRLSYFLWSSMPDSAMYELADSGKLTHPDVLRAQVKRLLKNERSWSFVENFTSQWLSLDQIDSIAVSPELYPDFGEHIKDDMKKETQYFFAHVLHENMSILNFIESDFTFLNERLQNHYSEKKSKAKASGSTTFRKVALPAKGERGGILTHAGILLAKSNGEDSHAIARGVWLVDKILGNPPPSPPADVEFDMEIEGFDGMSLKEQLAVHVAKASCAHCHMKFDPFGIAFEHYDAIGAFRGHVRKVDWKEYESRQSKVTRDPEVEFKKIDKNGNRSLSQEEWEAYVKIENQNKNFPTIRLSFEKVADVGKDKEQNSHPKNSISIEEYTRFELMRQDEALQGINDHVPYCEIAVDAQVQLPDKTTVNGVSGLRKYLLTHKKDDIAENIVRRLLSYAVGRALEFSDDQSVGELTEQFKNDDYKLATLIERIVLNDIFFMK